MKEKVEILVEHLCTDCVYDFADCNGVKVFLSDVMGKYGIYTTNPKNNDIDDIVIGCSERTVPPDNTEHSPPIYPPYRITE